MPDPAAERVEELRRHITHHNRLYYEEARQEISDREYDALYRELQDLEEAHPALRSDHSPTRRVGGSHWMSLCKSHIALRC